jgi:rhodanese-related sulfurtransferase
MPTQVNRDTLRKLMEDGGQLVEVLSAKQYEEVHLARAVNIPLSDLDQTTAAQLRKDRPVITYCFDYQ